MTLKTDNFDTPDFIWTTTHQRNRDLLEDWCDLAVGMETIRARWKPSIVVSLADGPQSLAELKQRMAHADRRVLIRALRELEADSLIIRSEHDRVRYGLTREGAELRPILEQLVRWQRGRSG